MDSLADMTNTDKPLSSTHHAHDGASRPHQLQPRAKLRRLEEAPRGEPWSTSSRKRAKYSVSQVQNPLEVLERDITHSVRHDIDSSMSPSTDKLNTD
jgi:hypothetical protein